MKFLLYLTLLIVACKAHTNFSKLYEGFANTLQWNPQVIEEGIHCIQSIESSLETKFPANNSSQPLQETLLEALLTINHLDSKLLSSCLNVYKEGMQFWTVNGHNISKNLNWVTYLEIVKVFIFFEWNSHIEKNLTRGRVVGQALLLLTGMERPSLLNYPNIATFDPKKSVPFDSIKFASEFTPETLRLLHIMNQTVTKNITQCAVNIAYFIEQNDAKLLDTALENCSQALEITFDFLKRAYLPPQEGGWEMF